MVLKAIFGGLVILIGLAALLFVGGSALLDDMCGNTVSRTLLSPDGTIKAVVFERDCGATTRFSEQLSLLAAGESLPNDGGNTFVTGGNGQQQVRVFWKDNAHLIVHHPPKEAVYHADESVRVGTRTVSVTYTQQK